MGRNEHKLKSTPLQHFVHLQQNAMGISPRVAITAVASFLGALYPKWRGETSRLHPWITSELIYSQNFNDICMLRFKCIIRLLGSLKQKPTQRFYTVYGRNPQQPPGMYKILQIMGRISHQPQLVSRIFSINSIHGVVFFLSPLHLKGPVVFEVSPIFDLNPEPPAEWKQKPYRESKPQIFSFFLSHVFFFGKKWCSLFWGWGGGFTNKKVVFFSFSSFCVAIWVFSKNASGRPAAKFNSVSWSHIGLMDQCWLTRLVDVYGGFPWRWYISMLTYEFYIFIGAPWWDWFNLYLFFFLLDRSTNG